MYLTCFVCWAMNISHSYFSRIWIRSSRRQLSLWSKYRGWFLCLLWKRLYDKKCIYMCSMQQWHEYLPLYQHVCIRICNQSADNNEPTSMCYVKGGFFTMTWMYTTCTASILKYPKNFGFLSLHAVWMGWKYSWKIFAGSGLEMRSHYALGVVQLCSAICVVTHWVRVSVTKLCIRSQLLFT